MDLLRIVSYDVENKRAKKFIFALFNNKLLYYQRKFYNKLISLYYKPTDYLRMLDYLTYYNLIHEFELDHYPFHNREIDDSICVYSITLLSLYVPEILKIKSEVCPQLKEIKPFNEEWILNFMGDEIEDIGYDNAHLELLILLDIIQKLEKYNVKPYYSLGLWLYSNISKEERINLEKEIIEKYSYATGKNIKKFVQRISPSIISYNEDKERKLPNKL